MDFVGQYRRLLFAQVLLGIVAFCIAQRSPSLLLIAGSAAAVAWYVTEGPHGRYLPRWAVNVGAILALAWPVLEMQWRLGFLGTAVGHFLLALQVVMLYSRRTNREDSALIVLSLMLVIAGSIVSDSMIYGLLLFAYSLLALPTLLLFNLKLTRDEVRTANQNAAPSAQYVPPPRAAGGMAYRLHLRAAAGLIALVCAGTTVLVFLFFPRWVPSSTASQLTGRFERSRTGYAEVMPLGNGAPLSGSDAAVMRISVRENGKSIGRSGEPWLVRGASLDHYDRASSTWQASRYAGSSAQEVDVTKPHSFDQMPPGGEAVTARFILMKPQGDRLFTLQPTVDGMSRYTSLCGRTFDSVTYDELNQNFTADGNFTGTLEYDITTPRTVGQLDVPGKQIKAMSASVDYATGWHDHRPAITRLALRILRRSHVSWPSYSRLVASSSTAPTRQLSGDPSARRAAESLCAFLRSRFRYTLQDRDAVPGEDPIFRFLFRDRRGHCELFAAGLAAMARSIGLPARVVLGFRASEYNSFGGYYVVRQRDAHAWTEIYCGKRLGWLTFDATPPAAVAAEQARAHHWYSTFRQFYDYLAFGWSGTIASYDQVARHELLTRITGRQKSASWVTKTLAWVHTLPQRWRLDTLDYSAAAILILLMLASLAIIMRMNTLRRRRLAMLQLTRLPAATRWAMGRKLRFYLLMLDMLDRHGYHRPVWQTPFAYAAELAKANPGRFDPVTSLTEMFYEIRFGKRPLNEARRARIRAHLRQLEEVLA